MEFDFCSKPCAFKWLEKNKSVEYFDVKEVLLDGEISKRIDEGIKVLQEARDKLNKKAKEIKQ